MNCYYRTATFLAAILFTCVLSYGTGSGPGAQDFSFLVCGDIHWCDESYYDLDAMREEKPGDWKQITGTYSSVTSANWDDFVSVLKGRIASSPDMGCMVQLGDMSEGLANTPGGASRIAGKVVDVLEKADFGVPLLLVKGNHDITGVGSACREEAKKAFVEYVTPYICAQTGTKVENADYTFRIGNVLFVVLDAWNPGRTGFLREALEGSDAEYKFVCMHEPVVPATERCWHYLKNDEAGRSPLFGSAQEYRQGAGRTGHGQFCDGSCKEDCSVLRIRAGRLRCRTCGLEAWLFSCKQGMEGIHPGCRGGICRLLQYDRPSGICSHLYQRKDRKCHS